MRNVHLNRLVRDHRLGGRVQILIMKRPDEVFSGTEMSLVRLTESVERTDELLQVTILCKVSKLIYKFI